MHKVSEAALAHGLMSLGWAAYTRTTIISSCTDITRCCIVYEVKCTPEVTAFKNTKHNDVKFSTQMRQFYGMIICYHQKLSLQFYII